MSDKIFMLTKILLIVLLFASPSYAGSSLAWDPPDTGTVTGYRIYYGSVSGNYPDKVEVDNVTQYELSNLSLKDNTEYFFVVRAYNDAGESGDSNEISWKSGDSTPPVTPQGLKLDNTTEGPRLSWTANAESDLNFYNVCYSTKPRDYGSFIPAGKVTGFKVPLSYLEAGKTYYFAVKAIDTAGNESGPSAEVSTTISLPDTTAPQLVISSPASGYKTSESSINIYGTASDKTGVTKITWTNSTGSSGAASGTTNWSISNTTLKEGINEIVVTAEDAAGNKGRQSLNVTYLLPDTTAPQVDIASPSTARTASFNTGESSISISGTASDDNEVTKVTWTNSSGGSGTASGTNNWSISNIALKEGINEIVVTAEDASGNKGRQSLNVTYLPPDTIDPIVSFVSPTTSSSYSTDKNTISISGTASDNVGVTKVIWSNSSLGSETVTGTNNWSLSNIILQEGINKIVITAEDAAGNIGSKTFTITYSVSDIIKPTISITSPKSRRRSIKKTKKQYLDISGTASDDKGVVQVSWENSAGSKGLASGTDEWTASGLELVEGKNIITITAIDAAGNNANQSFAIIYSP